MHVPAAINRHTLIGMQRMADAAKARLALNTAQRAPGRQQVVVQSELSERSKGGRIGPLWRQRSYELIAVKVPAAAG